ncbi:hypothetical protein P7K49_016702 [Saguinus oedipus]|uniref:Uncharacterized protein n=1 Tax=Saguinus oedipus TaxID=9490 RepID=A0ABQ9VCW3_SAGOE|nr:hypothetical protein P7K49_016702 [Saguinus oedipus]
MQDIPDLPCKIPYRVSQNSHPINSLQPRVTYVLWMTALTAAGESSQGNEREICLQDTGQQHSSFGLRSHFGRHRSTVAPGTKLTGQGALYRPLLTQPAIAEATSHNRETPQTGQSAPHFPYCKANWMAFVAPSICIAIIMVGIFSTHYFQQKVFVLLEALRPQWCSREIPDPANSTCTKKYPIVEVLKERRLSWQMREQTVKEMKGAAAAQERRERQEEEKGVISKTGTVAERAASEEEPTAGPILESRLCMEAKSIEVLDLREISSSQCEKTQLPLDRLLTDWPTPEDPEPLVISEVLHQVTPVFRRPHCSNWLQRGKGIQGHQTSEKDMMPSASSPPSSRALPAERRQLVDLYKMLESRGPDSKPENPAGPWTVLPAGDLPTHHGYLPSNIDDLPAHEVPLSDSLEELEPQHISLSVFPSSSLHPLTFPCGDKLTLDQLKMGCDSLML